MPGILDFLGKPRNIGGVLQIIGATGDRKAQADILSELDRGRQRERLEGGLPTILDMLGSDITPEQQALLGILPAESAVKVLGGELFRHKTPGVEVPFPEAVLSQKRALSDADVQAQMRLKAAPGWRAPTPGVDVPFSPEVAAQRKEIGAAGHAPPRWDTDITTLRMPDGTKRYYRTSTAGGFEEVQLPEGAQVESKYAIKDTGTGYVAIDEGTGQPVGQEVPKNVEVAATQEAVGKEGGKGLVANRQKAIDAQNTLASNTRARGLIDSGMVTGTGAQYLTDFGKALQQIGFFYNRDALANTETFIADRASEVGRVIKQFGSGTGLSDADRDYAQKAAGGQITMTKDALLRILDISDKQARWVMEEYGRDVRQYRETGKAPLEVQQRPGTMQTDAWTAPDGRTFTAAQIEATARKHGMTVDELKAEIARRAGGQ